MTTHQIGIAPFGRSSTGVPVQRISLGHGALKVSLLTWGAVLQDVHLDGVANGLTLGSDVLAPYHGAMRHHGSLIGPVVNRLSDAKAHIAGRVHRFEANQEGRHTLHGGRAGTHVKVWRLAEVTETSATLRLDLPDGDGGFPGNRRLTARFALSDAATLTLDVTATTDQTTLMNMANHSYWNLDGTPTWAGHSLRIAADRYLPTTPDFTPTGEIASVDGTDMDFRTRRTIRPGAPAMDNCFCLSDHRMPLRDVLWLTGQNGVSMTVATTEPGIQVYDGRAAQRPDRAPFEGLAIEAQGWPDAPNQPGFPSILLNPGETYTQTTQWRFNAGAAP